jgi:hypothetical protein
MISAELSDVCSMLSGIFVFTGKDAIRLKTFALVSCALTVVAVAVASVIIATLLNNFPDFGMPVLLALNNVMALPQAGERWMTVR